jgi:hypothetical protein
MVFTELDGLTTTCQNGNTRPARLINSLPIVCNQEDLFLCTDDAVPVMLHDIRNQGDDAERNGGGRAKESWRN